MLVLVANASGGQSILFCREKNMEREIWDGYRYGPDAARAFQAGGVEGVVLEHPAAVSIAIDGG